MRYVTHDVLHVFKQVAATQGVLSATTVLPVWAVTIPADTPVQDLAPVIVILRVETVLPDYMRNHLSTNSLQCSRSNNHTSGHWREKSDTGQTTKASCSVSPLKTDIA